MALSIAAVEALSLAAYGQSSPGSGTTSSSDSLLPRNAVVPKTVVNRFFPEVSQEASTGQNLTAVGEPKASRSVIYVNSDSSKKVSITVDQVRGLPGGHAFTLGDRCVVALAELRKRSARALARRGAWFGHRGQGSAAARVTKVVLGRSFVTRALAHPLLKRRQPARSGMRARALIATHHPHSDSRDSPSPSPWAEQLEPRP